AVSSGGERGHVVALLDGPVYNGAELAGAPASGAAALLAGYLAEGPSVISRANGAFAAAIWDGARKELLLARDRLGTRPLLYALVPGGAVFASQARAVLASAAVEAAIDEDGARQLLGRQRTIGATVWRGLSEVRPGELVTVCRTGCSARRYWRLEPRPHVHDARKTVSTVRELLEDVLRLQVDGDEPASSLLSGGIDSSAVAAVADLECRRRGTAPIRTYSVGFLGSDESFRPDELRPTLDAPYARLAAEHLGAAHTEAVIDSVELCEQASRSLILQLYDRPPVQEDYAGSLLRLYAETGRSSASILSGELADEQFRYEGQNMDADCFPWHVALGGVPPFSILRRDLEQRLGLDEFYRRQYAEALAESALVEDGDRGRMARRFTYLHLTRYSPVLLERQDRMSAAAGVDVRMPFGDHRLIEYVFNVPEDIRLFDGGRSKSVLRAAVADLLPREILERPSSQHPVPRGDAYDDVIAEEFRALAGQRSAPIMEIADPARMAWLTKDLDRGSSRIYVRRIRADVVALNRFLERYRPRLLFV
ncbi:MAG TPA: asparagine synthase-related protein, partial [Candidatus Eisenbacteria bacterium]|nr:asparagine synthase-related protein [Candidatus Eisenbacteria bacterium]